MKRPLLALSLLLLPLTLWAGGWWLFGGFSEIERHVQVFELAAGLLFAGATAVIAARLAGRIDWPRLDWLALTLWPIAAIGAVDAIIELQHPAQELGWVAWPAVIAAMLLVLRSREARYPALRGALHATGYWLVAGLAAWETHWLVARAAGGTVPEAIWPEAATLAVVAALLFATVRATETEATQKEDRSPRTTTATAARATATSPTASSRTPTRWVHRGCVDSALRSSRARSR